MLIESISKIYIHILMEYISSFSHFWVDFDDRKASERVLRAVPGGLTLFIPGRDLEEIFDYYINSEKYLANNEKCILTRDASNVQVLKVIRSQQF